ncbi:MAG TPA: SNF2-related protein, partial [Candidatus Saccharimonadia bacterium]|nr:SNF2-related protein [Candidatus Saccharimonadia bacterium]
TDTLVEVQDQNQTLVGLEGSECPTPSDVALGQLSVQGEIEPTITHEIAPEGWLTNNALGKKLDIDPETVRKRAVALQEDHPDWFGGFLDSSGHSNVHYHPDLIETLAKSELGCQKAPEGWLSLKGTGDLVGFSDGVVRQVVETYRESNPELFSTFRGKGGHVTEHFHPDLIAKVAQVLSERKPAPEGWTTVNSVAKALGVDFGSVKKVVDNYREEHPEWFGVFLNQAKRMSEHLSPDLESAISRDLSQYQTASDGWDTTNGVAKQLGVSFMTVRRVAETYREEHPEWFDMRKGAGRQLAEHFNPQLIGMIHENITGREPTPEGWVSNQDLAELLGCTTTTADKITDEFRQEHPEWFGVYRHSSGRLGNDYHPDLVATVTQMFSDREPVPEGWSTASAIATQVSGDHRRLKALAESYRQEHPEWFGVYPEARVKRLTEHYHPELVRIITEAEISNHSEVAERKLSQLEQKESRDDLKEFVNNMSQPESLESQEFQSLVELFGGERVIDILYQYHPEYKKISVPYVKSIIADYLGDFLTTPGGLDLENLEAGVEFLFDSSLKDGLTEVVKQDCLRFYNQQRKDGLTTDDLDAILEHISDLRGQTAHFSTEELGEVFEEVESYYRSLFEDIHKPECLVDELNPGRLFPDLNQRINIHEMATKYKMLIADEMGVGKSASAILTKEYLGVGLALIVAPSNVVDTWQNYLSDKVIDSEQVGYFKPGQAPRVLIVESLVSLEGINPTDYDYIVMSQERLNDRYVEALQEVNYGMLVVDEVHKMKNLISGKRAENLIKLADGIKDTDGAKYLALLSGTPIPNKVGDISMVLKLLYPEKFEGISNKELTNQILYGDALDLRSLLVPRMQMKSLAESIKMPNLEERIHLVELTAEEREMYEVLLEEDEIAASQKLQILRKFSLSPSLLDATPDINGSKIQEVGAALRETFTNRDKVVMFVNGYIEGVIRGDNTIVEALGLPEGIEVFAIEGEVEKDTRVAIQQQLQGSNRKMLVLVSGQTADVGVDFSGAEEVYFYNEPWTMYDKKQQLGRVYRPGLSEDLISRTFITRGTIEEGIHSYIGSKYKAIEKLLRGIPISDLEREMLKKSEDQSDPSLEVNPELAEYYFSSWDRMMKIYGYVKELGEDDFVKFLGKYGREYADCYVDVGGRSYQANASRLSGTLIDRFVRERRKSPQAVRVLDIASGPEMLKRHISDGLSDRVISLDINQHHFAEDGQNRAVGSFLSLPIADNSVDYANLSLALHYTNFVPTKGQYERIEVLQEINRVLSIGGRAVINLMHTLDLKDEPAFREAVTKLGFRVVERYTGKTEDGAHFRTRLFTLEKTHDSPRDIKEAVNLLGSSLMKGFKFTKSKAKLRDSRRIATSFSIEGQQGVKTKFNEADRVTLEEERITQAQMTKLQRKYGSVKEIPRDEVLAGGFSRIFNGKSHVLFRRLVAGSGSVVLR